MLNKSNSIKKFLQDNRQIFYSIALMIIIPCAAIVNALVFSSYFRSTLNASFQDKAISISESLNAGLVDKFDSPEKMQGFINQWQFYSENTEYLDIVSAENYNFKTIASLDKERIGNTYSENSFLYMLAISNDSPIAQEVSVSSLESGSRNYWRVVTPLKDLQGETKAFSLMYLSTGFVDERISEALVNSAVVLLVTIIFIILLLFANTRLFEYSILYNKIKEVDAMKDEFISMASHELRTPITVIKGYISLVLEKASSLSDELKEYLAIVNISIDRLNNLVEDLLNVSRIEQGRLKMELNEMEVWPIIEETVEEFKIQADEKKLALSCQIDPGSNSLIKIDKDRFKQVLINIIGNAIKYTPSGSVEVKVSNKNKNLAIMVKDTGIGMAAKEREHLFEKFYRVKSKKTEDIVGTGLGLWITKQIIELMSGSIFVDSMEGVGTQFTIEIPLIVKKQ